MIRKLTLTSLIALALTATASAQSFWPFGNGARHQHFHVQIRQLNWQERSFHHYLEARHFEDQKRDLGFEVIMYRHGPHWDVRFRLPTWQTLRTVGSHGQAHQLEHQLEDRGYEVRVVHH